MELSDSVCLKTKQSVNRLPWRKGNGETTNGGSRRGESELRVDDVVATQRNDEEDTKEASANSEGYELANVLLWELRQEAKTVHSGDSANEQDPKTTRS